MQGWTEILIERRGISISRVGNFEVKDLSGGQFSRWFAWDFGIARPEDTFKPIVFEHWKNLGRKCVEPERSRTHPRNAYNTMSSAEAITIQRATLVHADDILECLRTAFEPYRRAYSAPAYEDTVLTRESLLRRLEEMTVLVALDRSGRMVGTVAYKILDEAEGHLRGMAVRPECQGRDIADQLLERAEAEMIKCRRITLDTTEPLQRAMHFYERHGFHRSGSVRDFFGMPLIEYVKVRRSKK